MYFVCMLRVKQLSQLSLANLLLIQFCSLDSGQLVQSSLSFFSLSSPLLHYRSDVRYERHCSLSLTSLSMLRCRTRFLEDFPNFSHGLPQLLNLIGWSTSGPPLAFGEIHSVLTIWSMYRLLAPFLDLLHSSSHSSDTSPQPGIELFLTSWNVCIFHSIC